MKKTYSTPLSKIVRVETSSIICTSGVPYLGEESADDSVVMSKKQVWDDYEEDDYEW